MIEIDILWHTDQTRSLDEMDIDYDLDDCEKRRITFYSIDAIIKRSDNTEYTNIYACGTMFVTKMNYSSLKKLIENETSKT